MVADFQLRTGKDLKRIAAELRRMDDRELKKRLSKELRAAAKPMVPAVRQAIRNIPSKRAYSAAGLRGALSKAVKLEVKTSGKQAGIRLRVDGRKMPNKMGSLPKLMEGEGVQRGRRVDTRWRHPVFGKDRWVQQPPKPYFFKTVQSLGPRSRQSVNRVLDGISRDIT
ncbi:hypothetical protein [Streptomyces sp. NBC_00996]|uniref:hypothetical protein n=1 Tax=Streptomyces sp. NBC_00996 TaxID=2903710 RepID=UPI00386725A6|nr:hypothetical protein OG390_17195 [Streptomyces sp. NBC_00996]